MWYNECNSKRLNRLCSGRKSGDEASAQIKGNDLADDAVTLTCCNPASVLRTQEVWAAN